MKLINFQRKLRKRGVTLVEVLMVLGIMALILGMMMQFYSSAHQSMQANELLEEIFSLEDISNQLLVNVSSEEELDAYSNDQVINSGLLPKKWIDSPKGYSRSLISTPGYGSVLIEGLTWHGRDSYIIGVYGLTKKACILLATFDFGESLTSRYPSPSNDFNGTEPLSATDAVSQCSYINESELFFTPH